MLALQRDIRARRCEADEELNECALAAILAVEEFQGASNLTLPEVTIKLL